MMFNYPYLNFPYTRKYYTHYNTINSYRTKSNFNYSKNEKDKSFLLKDLSNTINNSDNNSSTSTNMEYFEIFGIKLFFDDILLICLLFFLYNEGIKDQYLFIALILLLLS